MHIEELSPKQISAAALLATGVSCKDAAKQCGVTPETISHWKRDPDFVVHLNELKSEAVDCAREKLRGLNEEAVRVLKGLLSSSSEPIRLQTARYVLDSMLVDPVRSRQGIGPTNPLLAKLSQVEF